MKNRFLNVCVCVCAVEPMFSAMCDCQALHPDPEDADTDDDDYEGEEYDVEEAGECFSVPKRIFDCLLKQCLRIAFSIHRKLLTAVSLFFRTRAGAERRAHVLHL